MCSILDGYGVMDIF